MVRMLMYLSYEQGVVILAHIVEFIYSQEVSIMIWTQMKAISQTSLGALPNSLYTIQISLLESNGMDQ